MLVSKMRLHLFLSITLMLFVLSVSPALCGDVSITATFGYGQAATSRSWTPVRVILKNTGGHDVEGRLTLDYSQSADRGGVSTSADVDLPANSTKAYTLFTLPPDYFSVCSTALRSGNRVVANASITESMNHGHDSVLVVAVGEKEGAPTFLNGDAVSRKLGSVAAIVVGAVSPDELLDRPAGYRGVDMLIITPASVSRATPEQLAALGVYAVSGGTLVVSAGPDYRALQTSFFDEMLPVQVTGAGAVSGFGAIAGGGKYAPQPGAVNVVVSRVKPGAGRVVRSGEGIPLIVERPYGQGRVVFLAFDCTNRPFTQWDGQRDFWKTVLQSGRSEPLMSGAVIQQYRYGYSGSSTTVSVDLDSVVIGAPSVNPPSLGTIGIFLLCYIIVLCPVNYVCLNRRKRLELAWLTVPVVVLLFAFVAWIIGFASKGSQSEMNTATVYETSSSCSYARKYTLGWMFSPSRRSYDVMFKDRDTLPKVFVSGSERSAAEVVLGDESYAEDVNTPMWSSTVFESDSGVDMGGRWDTNLTYDGAMLSGTVRNGTKWAVKDCRLAWGSSVTQIGSIRPGQTVRVLLAVRGSSPVGPYSPANATVASKLSAELSDFVEQKNRPCLIGVLPAGDTVDVQGFWGKRQSAACIVMPLEYKLGSVGLITSDRVRWQLDKGTSNDVTSLGQDGSNLKIRIARGGVAHVSGVINLSKIPKVRLLAIQTQSRHSSVPGSPSPLPPTGMPGGPPMPAAHNGPGVNAPDVEVRIYDCETSRWVYVEPDATDVLFRPARFLDSGNRIRLRLRSTGYGYMDVSVRIAAATDRRQMPR